MEKGCDHSTLLIPVIKSNSPPKQATGAAEVSILSHIHEPDSIKHTTQTVDEEDASFGRSLSFPHEHPPTPTPPKKKPNKKKLNIRRVWCNFVYILHLFRLCRTVNAKHTMVLISLWSPLMTLAASRNALCHLPLPAVILHANKGERILSKEQSKQGVCGRQSNPNSALVSFYTASGVHTLASKYNTDTFEVSKLSKVPW